MGLLKKDHIFIVKKVLYNYLITTFVSGRFEMRWSGAVFSSGKPGRRTCRLGSKPHCLASTCRKNNSGKRSKHLGKQHNHLSMRPGTSTSTGKTSTGKLSKRMGRLKKSRPKLL